MIKVKAFGQLKSGLYGQCVMIYKFDQVSTKFHTKWIICSCIEAPTLTTECGFNVKKNPKEILLTELVSYQ